MPFRRHCGTPDRWCCETAVAVAARAFQSIPEGRPSVTSRHFAIFADDQEAEAAVKEVGRSLLHIKILSVGGKGHPAEEKVVGHL